MPRDASFSDRHCKFFENGLGGHLMEGGGVPDCNLSIGCRRGLRLSVSCSPLNPPVPYCRDVRMVSWGP